MNISTKLKNNKKTIIILLIVIAAFTIIKIFISDISVPVMNNFPTDEPIHAPNMWVHWKNNSEEPVIYDAFTIDWRCIDDADETFWAVHCWDDGYAGFQNDLCGNKVLLLSLWDLPDGTKPIIQYHSSDYNYGNFGNEGTGVFLFTPFEWEVGEWYSMKVEISYGENSTFFTQYIKEGYGEWQRTACISYPIYYEISAPPSSFQEDFCPNNLKRSCEIRNAGGSIIGTQDWKMWDACEIVTSYYPYFGEQPEVVFDNISFDCDYEVHDSTIKLIAGGSNFQSNKKQYPAIIPLS